MSDRVTVRGLDPAGGTPGQVPTINAAGTRVEYADPGGGGGSTLPAIDVVNDHGAAIDGATDDTAAWQAAINAAAAAGGGRIISSRNGVSIIAGALQDTGDANAQLVLPSINAATEQIVITIEGAIPPPPCVSVVSTIPTPDNHLVLKSTLTAGSGGALLGCPSPTGFGFSVLTLQLKNVAFRMPANPTHTALDLRNVECIDLDNVIADAGSYNVGSLAEPTTSTSYGIRVPKQANGASTRLGATTVVGFYNGYEFAEHSNGQHITAMGCKRAFVFASALHASKFQRMLAQHCQKNVVFTASHYVDIDQLAIEHAASGWWVTTADVDDPSNYGHGKIKWHACLAGGGVDTTFVQTGGSGITAQRVGVETAGTSLTVQDENGTVATGVTQIDFQGANVSAAAGSGEVVVTVTGSTPSSSGEQLMQDGVTAPPVPLENEARDDWLYQG